jgi:hypothetical protein
MLFGLVYGRLRAYRLQNTDDSHFLKMAKLLARRLCARGYSFQTLLPVFKQAGERLAKSDPRLPQIPRDERPCDATTAQKAIIFHLLHHPRGITRQQVRAAYSEIVGPLMPDRNLVIAVSRPPNIKDRVCRTRLPDIIGDNPSDYLITGDDTVSPQILPRR